MSLPNDLISDIYKECKDEIVRASMYVMNSIEDVLNVVSLVSGISVEEFKKDVDYRTRERIVLDPLAVYYKICAALWPKNNKDKVGLKKIGALVGKHHATVLHHLQFNHSAIFDLYTEIMNNTLIENNKIYSEKDYKKKDGEFKDLSTYHKLKIRINSISYEYE